MNLYNYYLFLLHTELKKVGNHDVFAAIVAMSAIVMFWFIILFELFELSRGIRVQYDYTNIGLIILFTIMGINLIYFYYKKRYQTIIQKYEQLEKAKLDKDWMIAVVFKLITVFLVLTLPFLK